MNGILERPAPGEGCVAKPEASSEFTCEYMISPKPNRSLNPFQVVPMRSLDAAASFTVGCRVANAESTGHDLMPAPPFNALYVIL